MILLSFKESFQTPEAAEKAFRDGKQFCAVEQHLRVEERRRKIVKVTDFQKGETVTLGYKYGQASLNVVV